MAAGCVNENALFVLLYGTVKLADFLAIATGIMPAWLEKRGNESDVSTIRLCHSLSKQLTFS